MMSVEHPFCIVDVTSPAHPRFPQFAALYAREFQHDTTAESIEFFRGSRDVDGKAGPFAYKYRLWGLAVTDKKKTEADTERETDTGADACAATEAAALEGFASFYSLPRCGFGGYLALCGALRGRGLLRGLMRRMEAFMRASNPHTHGWYVECEPASAEAAIFKRCGFTQVPITYLQPQLVSDTTGISNATPLELLYKPLPMSAQREGRAAWSSSRRGERSGKFPNTHHPPETSSRAELGGPSSPTPLPTLTVAELKRNLIHIMFACYDLDEPAARRHLARMTFPCADVDDVFASASRSPCP